MEEQRRERAHHQHQGKGAEGEHERGLGPRLLERHGPAAEIAEDECRSGLRRTLDHLQRGIEREDRLAQRRHQQHERGEHGLQREARRDQPPADGATILGHGPRDRDEEGEARGGVQGLGDVHGRGDYRGSGAATGQVGSETAIISR